MRVGRACCLFGVLVLAIGVGVADARSRSERKPATAAASTVTASRIDGSVDDGAWNRAAAITAFVQRDPKEGAPPSFPTEARVLYDRDFLYIQVRAFDTDAARIVGIRTRRDSDSPSDWIRVVVDSYHDRKTAYEFAVNAAGVKQDTYWFGDSNSDVSWDAVWDVSVARDDKGWTARFRIPFSQLRFRPGSGNAFGFAVIRQVGRLNESSSWPLIKKGVPGYVSQFGELGGLELASAGKRLEVSPYTVGKVIGQPLEAGNPFIKSPDATATVGADIKYAMTPGLTVTSTINPDFGQVEADPAVVNLTAFETFYQERRPFFVEGSGNLQFDLDCNDGRCTGLFYSRRIGRTPHGDPVTPDGGFAYSPAQTTILGAAKLTGRAGAFAIGALDAVASNETARLATATNRWQQTVEPLTNYAVMQAKREWSNQSSLGFMFTNTARRLDADVRSLLPSTATTGGVNWDWRFPGRRYSLTGYWAGSSVHGDALAINDVQQNAVHNCQRPDQAYLTCDPASTSLNGHAAMINFQKIGGERVRFSFNGGYKTPGFDVNDVGYLQRADSIEQSGWVQIRWDKPTSVYRNVRLNFNQWSGWNFGGDRRFTGTNVNAHITLVSNWMAGIGLNYQAAGIDDRSARGGPGFRTKRGGNIWYYIQSDERKRVNGAWQSFVFRDEAGATDWGFDPQLTYRPASFLSISGGVHFEKMNEDTQWVENVEDSSTRHVFGRLQQTTLGLTARLNYTITPTLTVQLYAQPFVSAGAYRDFKDLVHPRATPFAAQFEPYAYTGEPDFNYRSFRMTNVLRWEYRPGSALYVVWQQGREDTATQGRFHYGSDVGSLFGTPGINVFLVKLSYWLNL